MEKKIKLLTTWRLQNKWENYFDKINDKNCFPSGYFYTTNRTLKLSDILFEYRTKKLEIVVK